MGVLYRLDGHVCAAHIDGNCYWGTGSRQGKHRRPDQPWSPTNSASMLSPVLACRGRSSFTTTYFPDLQDHPTLPFAGCSSSAIALSYQSRCSVHSFVCMHACIRRTTTGTHCLPWHLETHECSVCMSCVYECQRHWSAHFNLHFDCLYCKWLCSDRQPN